MSSLLSLPATKSEDRDHEVIKNFVYKQVLKHDARTRIYKASLEKFFGIRRADVYFKYKSGKEAVVEIQNSPMSSKEIIKRTQDYNRKGTYVLWIINGQGKCVGSPKFPNYEKDKKISPAEMRLHQLHGGRVYYINVKRVNGKILLTRPFTLHFSKSDKYSPTLFKKGHEYFFIRNVNFTIIPSWNLAFNSYYSQEHDVSYRLARFYDKNLKYILTSKINDIARQNGADRNKEFQARKMTKELFNTACKCLGKFFGTFFIIEVLLHLINTRRLLLDVRYLQDTKEKLKKKATKKFK